MPTKPLTRILFSNHNGFYNEIEKVSVYGDIYRIFQSNEKGSNVNHIIAIDENNDGSVSYVFETMNADWNKVKDFLDDNDEWVLDDSPDF